ncbi:hypothetical protein L0156_26730 [bacterium]|nr:hypothetical protein [bacterium]
MRKSNSIFWLVIPLRFLLVLLLTVLPFFGIETAQAADTTFSGQATVVSANVLGNEVVLSDTGPLPSSGGSLEASLLEATVPGLLTAEVLHASTIGQGNTSRSEASVANLSLTVGGNTITADFLMARAEAKCSQGRAFISGSSEIVNVVINGQQIVVSGAPNQTIDLPNGRVVINEQTTSVDGKTSAITVNALHVTVDGIADVIISSAHADISCRNNPACDKDFTTGGGFITLPTSARANFGVAGGIKNGGFWGHLTYIDHGTGMKVKGTGVTAYVVVNNTTRHIEGTAEINGQGGFTYQVDVSDNGEPGRNDTFSISLSNGYFASGKLSGGNIQLHVCK